MSAGSCARETAASTHVGSVVVPSSDDCVSGSQTKALQGRVRVAVGVGSGSRASLLERSGGDGASEGDGSGDDGG